MNTHTPGPWKLRHVQGNNFAVQRFEIRSEEHLSYPIFQKDCSAIDGGSVCCSPEDAKLIAAAPDLLRELLQVRDAIIGQSIDRTARDRLVTVGRRMELSLDRINTALAKAGL